jgi:signal transduction histidine kinase
MAVVLRQSGGSGKTPIGVLNVEHREIGGLTKEDHAGVLVGMANLAALAINNVQQANELEKVRNDAIVNEAVAWMGIFAAESQHTMAQKISSMRYCLDTLRVWSSELPDSQRALLIDITDDLHKIVNDIQAIRPPETIALMADVPTSVDFELHQSISLWCEEHNRDAAQPIALVFDLQCTQIQIQVPARILRIATEKLVHNAFKAMREGGTLTVQSRRNGMQVQILLTDTGAGIPDFARNDFLKRPIHRPHADGQQGSGMGALMARIVARRHQGNLEVLQTGAVGTTLCLSFPIANGGIAQIG